MGNYKAELGRCYVGVTIPLFMCCIAWWPIHCCCFDGSTPPSGGQRAPIHLATDQFYHDEAPSYVVYLNHGTLSASSRSSNFCSSVNSCAPLFCAIFSLRPFSIRHHVDMKKVRQKATLQVLLARPDGRLWCTHAMMAIRRQWPLM